MAAEPLAELAGTVLIKKAVGEVYSLLKRSGSKRMAQYELEEAVKKIRTNIRKIRKVKTIWQVDKAVDLQSFFVAPNFKVGGNRVRVSLLDDIKVNDNLLIEGVAGQGKSIFLRYICGTELYRDRYIPVFFELRKIEPDKTLKHHLFESLELIGLPGDDETFDILVKSGRMLLLLDAFDEVDNSLKRRVVNEIEKIASTTDQLKVLVTSRPDSGLNMSNYFTVIKIDSIQNGEYQEYITKLSKKEDDNHRLITELERSHSNIIELLTTPLMITLLVITYKSRNELPKEFIEFYDVLFFSLLSRHDGAKPGFKRQRRCNLDDMQYRFIFDAICMRCKSGSHTEFSLNRLYSYTKLSMDKLGINENPESYLRDIRKITGLLLRDGTKFRFIHKSVQEFFAASYINRFNDIRYQAISKEVIRRRLTTFYKAELSYLCSMDRYRFIKYFYRPCFLEALKPIGDIESQQKIQITDDTMSVLMGLDGSPGDDSVAETLIDLCPVKTDAWVKITKIVISAALTDTNKAAVVAVEDDGVIIEVYSGHTKLWKLLSPIYVGWLLDLISRNPDGQKEEGYFLSVIKKFKARVTEFSILRDTAKQLLRIIEGLDRYIQTCEDTQGISDILMDL